MHRAVAAAIAAVAAVAVAALALARPAAAWLPGLKPRNYVTGQRVPLRMHEMRAPALPGVTRNYYDLPGVCAPASTASEYENFGEALSGHDVPCTPLCTHTLGDDDVRAWHARIEDGYRMQMSADGLPIVQQSLYHGADAEQITRYDMGVPLGYMRPRGAATELAFNGSDEAYAYVHLDLRVQYHLSDDGEYSGARIVGFFATPRALPCGVAAPYSAAPLAAGNVTWTYSVRWQSVERTWGARFDVYALPDMSASSASVHASSIGIGLAAMLLLFVGAYSTLNVRVRRDLARYRRVKGEAAEPDDDTGWKRVAGDVFRPPRARELLCAIVGTGVQLAVMIALTLAAAAVGLTTDYYRGVMLSTVIVLHVALSSVGGYTSARLYRAMGGGRPLVNFVLAWGGLPAVMAVVFIASDAALVAAGSSAALGAQVIATAAAVWLGVSLGLSAIGYYVGHRATPPTVPVLIVHAPRPEPDWAKGRAAPIRLFDAARRSTASAALFVGFLSFGLVLWPFYYLFASFWAGRVYSLFVTLATLLAIWIGTNAVVTMLFTYWYLSWERWHWQWRALVVGGGSALCVAVFAGTYARVFLPHAGAEAAGIVYYACYTLLLCVVVFCVLGSISFLASARLVYSMYAAAKPD